ncbi:TPA: VapD [Neisseria meningitidis]|uniref:virulence-associated protein VapD n=1 Tax=Neisseria meningitidis TaxID=487 RepID=UPI00027CBE68|nr:virulence-associated protein VapD [Neisseria meningitidis]EJU65641.1 virulence associated protein D [Neisseria meningitidis 98008]MBG9090021.1 VapD [Neisseria meningitidis]MCE9735951.1 VapD [Neisseria meningitidis]
MSRYLITFDMDTNRLKDNYHGNNYTNAYSDIKTILARHGFENIQGSVYLGREGISEAHGTIAIQELTARFDWFYSCISNIKFYRLESDLNAQFIADGVYQAKQAFLQRVEQLRISLTEAGLSDEQINQVLEKQKFELESPNLKLN